jgi:hypothetical protein
VNRPRSRTTTGDSWGQFAVFRLARARKKTSGKLSKLSPKPQFVLHLEASPRGGDHDGMRRLRAVLKALLRCWGFRCRWIAYPTEASPLDAASGRRHQDAIRVPLEPHAAQ